MKFIQKSQKDAYFGKNDLGERISRMTHYRERVKDEE